MKFRKLLRNLHRDFGYLIAGMVLIYAVSGIALNHKKDWNADHVVVRETVEWGELELSGLDREALKNKLELFKKTPVYKKHYTGNDGALKVFVENGMVVYRPSDGYAEMELLEKRPLFYHINKLHKVATIRVWVWVSDVLAVVLVFVAVSGLFLLKGKYGITGRGWWLTLLGFLVPGIFLFFYII
ncbi:PepSY-associated TM helix domain-containing protein [Gaoshiqia sp. Z1-71]|uniref:PepSY-associated TM helix domain-containing protein n=1 Tax=Gaoshiqia hydrogeniformans TaxID=3290090 RepID=UPI003BF8B1EB